MGISFAILLLLLLEGLLLYTVGGRLRRWWRPHASEATERASVGLVVAKEVTQVHVEAGCGATTALEVAVLVAGGELSVGAGVLVGGVGVWGVEVGNVRLGRPESLGTEAGR
jgi:hypothetical protein